MTTSSYSQVGKFEGAGSAALQILQNKDIPMRLSVLCGDPNYTQNAKDFNVHFDGVKQTHCIIADSENGYILRYKKTSLGTLRKGRNGKFETEELFGNVVITRK